jgi:anti-sigma B factor antagonist
MRITERTVGHVTVLDVQGRMTVNEGYGTVKRSVGELLSAGQRQLVLNLDQVPYLDSGCVGELVAAFLTTRTQGGMLKFAGARGRIAELFTIAKLDTVFELFETETEAVTSFSSS